MLCLSLFWRVLSVSLSGQRAAVIAEAAVVTGAAVVAAGAAACSDLLSDSLSDSHSNWSDVSHGDLYRVAPRTTL